MKTLITAKILVEHAEDATVDELKDAFRFFADVGGNRNRRKSKVTIKNIVVDHMEAVS